MAPMNIIYISLEGNTRSFLTRMQGYAKQQHSISEDRPLLELKKLATKLFLPMRQNPSLLSYPHI